MLTKITMPQLGESVTEGTINRWLVREGEYVEKYDPLCEVMTDKVNAEVPSSYAGKVAELVVQENQTVKVGSLICYIEEAQSSADDSNSPVQDQKMSGPSEHRINGAATSGLRSDEHVPNPTDADSTDHTAVAVAEADKQEDMKHRYSPAVLKLAQEHRIQLAEVRGTGRGGRITRKDMLRYIEEQGKKKTANASPSAQSVPLHSARQESSAEEGARPKTEHHSSAAANDTVIPISGMRRTIANRMIDSKNEIPHAWTMIEVDVTDLVKYRNSIKEDYKKKEGVNLTFLPFFVKATVEALREYPIVNSRWENDRIIEKKDIHISIAVGTEEALYVPVIKHADEKNIIGLARSINELARKARAGELDQTDVEGGTFTVNNTGSFGSIQSAPIINYPQAAILSVESIVKRPVVINDMIAIRSMVNLCLSLDHRILDGIICGRFLSSIKEKLQAYGKGISVYS